MPEGLEPAPARLAVGKITRAHGVKGEVAVLVLSEVEHRFDPDVTLFLEDGRSLVVESSRPDRGRMLVQFRELGDRNAAEMVRGAYLFVPEDQAPELPQDSWWPHQLEGCEVVTEGGRPLGSIREVVLGPANDLWIAGSPDEEVLIPALKDVVVSVDTAARRIVVRDLPGITTPSTD